MRTNDKYVFMRNAECFCESSQVFRFHSGLKCGFLSEFRNLGFLSPGILSLGILSVGILSAGFLSCGFFVGNPCDPESTVTAEI